MAREKKNRRNLSFESIRALSAVMLLNNSANAVEVANHIGNTRQSIGIMLNSLEISGYLTSKYTRANAQKEGRTPRVYSVTPAAQTIVKNMLDELARIDSKVKAA